MCAARKGDGEWLTKLMETGADVNVINKLGKTAFRIARNKQHENCMSILENHGADVNIPDLRLSADHENREDINRISTATDVLQLKVEELDTVDSVRINLEQACALSNQTEDTGILSTSCEPQFVVEMFEEEPATVECGVHSGVKRPEV